MAMRRLLGSSAGEAAVHHAQEVRVLQRRRHALLVVQLLVDRRLRCVPARRYSDIHLTDEPTAPFSTSDMQRTHEQLMTRLQNPSCNHTSPLRMLPGSCDSA